MNGITLMIIGVSVAINIFVIKVKLEKARYSDVECRGSREILPIPSARYTVLSGNISSGWPVNYQTGRMHPAI